MACKWSVRCQTIAQANQDYIYGEWIYIVLGLTNSIQVSQAGWKHIFSTTPPKMWIAVGCLLTQAMYLCLIWKMSVWILGILKMSTTICRPGVRFANDSVLVTTIGWKFWCCCHPTTGRHLTSLQINLHFKTAQLSCHVRNYVAITVLVWRCEPKRNFCRIRIAMEKPLMK